MAVKRTTKNVLEWCVRDLLGLRRELLNPNEVEILNECSRLSKVGRRRVLLMWEGRGGGRCCVECVSVCVLTVGEDAGQPVAEDEGPE